MQTLIETDTHVRNKHQNRVAVVTVTPAGCRPLGEFSIWVLQDILESAAAAAQSVSLGQSSHGANSSIPLLAVKLASQPLI